MKSKYILSLIRQFYPLEKPPSKLEEVEPKNPKHFHNPHTGTEKKRRRQRNLQNPMQQMHTKFEKANTTREGIKILPSSPADYTKITGLLKTEQRQPELHLFQLPSEKKVPHCDQRINSGHKHGKNLRVDQSFLWQNMARITYCLKP